MKHDVYKYICFLLCYLVLFIGGKSTIEGMRAATLISATIFLCAGFLIDALKPKE